MNDTNENAKRAVEQKIQQGLGLSVADLVIRYSVGATTIRNRLTAYETVSRQDLPRDESRSWLVPINVVQALDYVNTWMADDNLLTTKEAVNDALKRIAEDSGLPYTTPSTVVADLLPATHAESNTQIRAELHAIVKSAFEEQAQSITRVQDRTLEVSQRLDLWQRQSTTLTREIVDSVRLTVENAGYIKNAARLAGQAIAEAKKVTDQTVKTSALVKANVILVLLGGAVVIVLEAVVYGYYLIQVTFFR
jgi:hypothetical protein